MDKPFSRQAKGWEEQSNPRRYKRLHYLTSLEPVKLEAKIECPTAETAPLSSIWSLDIKWLIFVLFSNFMHIIIITKFDAIASKALLK